MKNSQSFKTAYLEISCHLITKRVFLSILTLIVFSFGFGQTFCTISYSDDAYITDVLIDGTSIRSSAADGGYINTGVTSNLTVGQTFSISSEREGDASFTYYHQVWFDWDDDGVFDDFYNMGSSNVSPNTQTQSGIIVPVIASGNTIRMRVTLNFNGYLTSSPCNTDANKATWGETEDYELIITPSCAPTTSFSSTCNSDLTYDVEVNISNLNGNSGADITDGTTIFYTGVGVGTYLVNGLTGSQTITVISTSSLLCTISNTFSPCDPCSLPTVPTDECIDAPLIDLSQPFSGSTNCTYTVSTGSPSACGFSIDNDSWISFIASSDTVSLDYTIGDCSNDDGIQLNVFSGTCGSLSLLAGSCAPNPTGENLTNNWTFTGMTIGASYYIRIDGYAGDLCDYSFTPQSGVAVTPPNDSCINATPIICGQTDTADIVLSTDNDAPTACPGGGTPETGIWYSIVGTGSSITLSTDHSATNFDTEINVYSGNDCNTISCIAGDNDSGSGTTSELTFTSVNGQTYYIYIDGNSGAIGTFGFSASCSSCDASTNMSWD